MTPRATMRLQFHKDFTFADAERLVPYFTRLGISHVYASPITTARPGSMHGYDVIDPTRVNSELGGEEGLRRLVTALHTAGLGLIVDIVPNHMAVGHHNAWWFDVLKHGQASHYASYFDIDWDVEDESLRGKILLPVLGKPLREVLDAGEIILDREPQGIVARYFDQRYPIAGSGEVERWLPSFDPRTRRTRERLGDLLSRQHYRLACWHVANDTINWRRFFDINALAGLRMEHPSAFEDVHALIFRLYAEGLIDGVRVDHIDGLADPAGYCAALRRRLDTLTEQRPSSASRDRAYLVVEKILLRGEALPGSWACDGTSGYDFMNEVSAVQHDARAESRLGALWESISGRSADFPIEEQAARREIIARSFSGQLEACAATFHRLARAEAAELGRPSLRRALVELLAHFPVYRTYAVPGERPISDQPFIARAVAGAKTTAFSTDRAVIDLLSSWLTRENADPALAAIQNRATTQFQQLSAPVAAKAVEDTAFYRYGRLLSRNDVGFDVTRFGDGAADFHAGIQRRRGAFPHAMLATATHDHKRGEDVRARLAVLSEYADEWADRVPRWIEQCRPLRQEVDGALLPSASDIAMLLQMLVGAWPFDLHDDEGRRAFGERLAQWQEKALREAKLATDWSIPNQTYEAAARRLVMSLVANDAIPQLLSDIVAFVQRIAPAGAVNGLAQTLLKHTVPGVPDIYQGTELWDLSLVDPDNRRPVDFQGRLAGLGTSPSEEAKTWRSGLIKQALIVRTLALRRSRPDLFAQGSYQPLAVTGRFADRIVAFARRLGSDVAITVVPRAASRLLAPGDIAFARAAWEDTSVVLIGGQAFISVLDGRTSEPGPVNVERLLDRLPCALLHSQN